MAAYQKELVRIWLDAHLSPALARYINDSFEGVAASSLRSLGLRDAEDEEIFAAAREANAVIMSKDADLATLLVARRLRCSG